MYVKDEYQHGLEGLVQPLSLLVVHFCFRVYLKEPHRRLLNQNSEERWCELKCNKSVIAIVHSEFGDVVHSFHNKTLSHGEYNDCKRGEHERVCVGMLHLFKKHVALKEILAAQLNQFALEWRHDSDKNYMTFHAPW